MNVLGIEIPNNHIQEGIAFLFDPDNRMWLIGIGILFIIFIARFIFKSIKRLFFIAMIIGLGIYFYLQFAINGT